MGYAAFLAFAESQGLEAGRGEASFLVIFHFRLCVLRHSPVVGCLIP